MSHFSTHAHNCSGSSSRWLWPGSLSSTANAMAQVPAAGVWLLPVHAALPGRALLASLSSVHMARALCLQDRAFLPLNHLCPRSGRDTTLPVFLAVLGAGSLSYPLFIWAAEQHLWKWCSSPALLEYYCFISPWGPWCAHETRQSSKLVHFTLSHLHCLYNSEWCNEFRIVCGNRGKCVIIYIFIHTKC